MARERRAYYSNVERVLSWLATRPDTVQTPTPPDVRNALPTFVAEKAKLKIPWGEDILWIDVVLATRRTVPLEVA